MPSFNKVILAGNLTRDPELRYTPKGTAVVQLGLAINRHWKDESGNDKEEVTFVDVNAFGRLAEVISQYLKKGRPILIEGRLKLDQWDDRQTNQKRSRLTVVLESFQFLDSGGGGDDHGDQRQRPAFQSRLRSGRTDDQQRPAPASGGGGYGYTPPSDDMPPDAEDDVPF